MIYRQSIPGSSYAREETVDIDIVGIRWEKGSETSSVILHEHPPK